jgi:flagellar assembly protein FliH
VAKMTGIQKFLFDHSFDTDTLDTVEELVEIDVEEIEETLPTFSEEELRSARDEAFTKGKEQGIKEEAAERKQSLLGAMERLEEQFNNLFKSQEEAATSNLNNAILVATTICRKIFPALNERGALEEVEHMVVETIEKTLEEPKVSICIHPDLEPLLKEHINSLSKKANYKAEIKIIPTEDISLGDCRVEWECGGAQRNTENLWQEIDEIVKRNLQETTAIAAGSDENTATEPTINEDTTPEQQGS